MPDRLSSPVLRTALSVLLASMLVLPAQPAAAQGGGSLVPGPVRRIEGAVPQPRIDAPLIERDAIAITPDLRASVQDAAPATAPRPQPFVMALGCGDTRVVLHGATVRHDDDQAAGLHADLRAAIDRFRSEGREIMAIALTPDCRGGTVVARGASFTRNVGGAGTDSYFETIKRLVDREGRTVYAVAFDPYGWASEKGYVIAYDGGLATRGAFAGDGATARELRGQFGRLHRALAPADRARSEALSLALASRSAGTRPSGFAVVTARHSFTRNVGGAEPNYYAAVEEMDARSTTAARGVAFNFPARADETRRWALSVGPCVVTAAPGFEPCYVSTRRVHVETIRPESYPCLPAEQGCSARPARRDIWARLDPTGPDVPAGWPVVVGGETYALHACDPDLPLSASTEAALDVGWSIDGSERRTNGMCKTFAASPIRRATGTVYLDRGHAIMLNGEIRAGSAGRDGLLEGVVGLVGIGQSAFRPLGDVWIVALGDSWASGEGAPAHSLSPPARGRAEWLHDRGANCHVSPASWPMVVADRLARAHPFVEVTISQFACSGAEMGTGAQIAKDGYRQIPALARSIEARGRVPDLVLLSVGGNDLGFAGAVEHCLLFGCDGEDFNRYLRTLPLCQARGAAGEASAATGLGAAFDYWRRKGEEAGVGALFDLASDVEGRMLDLADEYCFRVGNALASVEKVLRDEPGAQVDLSARYATLQGEFSKLGIDPERVVLAPYYDPTRNASGVTATCEIIDLDPRACPASRLPGYDGIQDLYDSQIGEGWIPDLPPLPHDLRVAVSDLLRGYMVARHRSGALEDDFTLARERIIAPLTAYQRRTAATLGWHFAEPAAATFARGGICARPGRRVNGFCHAIRDQGDWQGAFHPNVAGHEDFGERVATFVMGIAGTPPATGRSLAQALRASAPVPGR